MSGPKGFGYLVVSAAELRRREDEARSGRCQQHVIALAGLVAQLDYYGAPLPEPVKEPSSRDHDSLIAWESLLQNAIGDVQNQVRQASAKAIARRLNVARQAVDVSGVSLGGRPAPVRSTSSQSPSLDDERGRVSADVEKVVALIAGLRDPDMRDELTRIAECVLQTTSIAQAKGDLLTLKTKANSALELQTRRDQANQAVLGVAGVQSVEADRLRGRAALVETVEDLSALKRDVAMLVQQETSAADAQFVQDALAEALAELGFIVADGFEVSDYTDAAKRPFRRAVAVADHADHPGYGVRFQVNPSNAMLYTRVLSEGASTAQEDARAEQETCAKVHEVAKLLRQHGVAAELSTERLPGETAVEHRAASTRSSTATPAKKTKRRVDTRERPR